MDLQPLNHRVEVPLYRQLFEQIAEQIRSGKLPAGERLPATRELAGSLGLNRATVSAAYELLESGGLISGHVGRGSFVSGGRIARSGVDWQAHLARAEEGLVGRDNSVLANAAANPGTPGKHAISFAVSRPAESLFPLEDFRAACAAVLARSDLREILQLGSPSGFEPLRRFLLENARREGLAQAGDDLIITNGCQQALDLIGRVLLRPGDSVVLEDPVHSGLQNLMAGMGARLLGVAVEADGIDLTLLRRALERERPRLIVVTSNFQNPTGTTLPLPARHALLEMARGAGVPVIENDPYVELRYHGAPLPALKQLDGFGGTVLLRSFSKVSFPGLRVGWVLGPKLLIDRLRQAKETSDLHTDQLSQAVLLEFAESGRLEAHRARVRQAGAERLAAVLVACREFLPPGTRWTEPEGGMNLWVRLPKPLGASELLVRTQARGVTFLPGRYFEIGRRDPGALRLSFAGLEVNQIRKGLEILGEVIAGEQRRADENREPVTAMV
ncbi:MAG: PLP-dependent aminotransferase family protein [Acidobacteriia bacterium]|nr:PLP-dependent aminotransferase family protein [Terriglobia bacterium]